MSADLGAAQTVYSGSVLIGGKLAAWRRNPARGGVIIEFDAFTLALTGEPTRERIMCAIEGFLDGYVQGKQDGRSMLQNEFRNLMGLQR